MFIYEITPEVNTKYCATHLPKFLERRNKAGLLKTTDEWEKGRREIVAALTPVAVSTELEPEEIPSTEDEVSLPTNLKKKTVKKTTK